MVVGRKKCWWGDKRCGGRKNEASGRGRCKWVKGSMWRTATGVRGGRRKGRLRGRRGVTTCIFGIREVGSRRGEALRELPARAPAAAAGARRQRGRGTDHVGHGGSVRGGAARGRGQCQPPFFSRVPGRLAPSPSGAAGTAWVHVDDSSHAHAHTRSLPTRNPLRLSLSSSFTCWPWL